MSQIKRRDSNNKVIRLRGHTLQYESFHCLRSCPPRLNDDLRHAADTYYIFHYNGYINQLFARIIVEIFQFSNPNFTPLKSAISRNSNHYTNHRSWWTHGLKEAHHICSWARVGCRPPIGSVWRDRLLSRGSNSCQSCSCDLWPHSSGSQGTGLCTPPMSWRRWGRLQEKQCCRWPSM